MTTVTYIIIAYNKENYIDKVISSLLNIQGNFRKEFIIINNGSTDNTLDVIKKSSNELPNLTVLTQSNRQDFMSIIKNGIDLSNGDFIHFVDDSTIIDSYATKKLLKACLTYKSNVAYGISKYINNTSIMNNNSLYLCVNPVEMILNNKLFSLINLNLSGFLFNKAILNKINFNKYENTNPIWSLVLYCSLHSDNFVFFKEVMCYSLTKKQNDILSILRSIYCFIDEFEGSLVKYAHILYSLLWKILFINNKSIKILGKYLYTKYFKTKLPIEEVKLLYWKYITQLSKKNN